VPESFSGRSVIYHPGPGLAVRRIVDAGVILGVCVDVVDVTVSDVLDVSMVAPRLYGGECDRDGCAYRNQETSHALIEGPGQNVIQAVRDYVLVIRSVGRWARY
jgi:hypothetical protein